MGYKVQCQDGRSMARLVVDHYLNNYCMAHGDFMEAMERESRKIRDNFTYLVFAWFKGLSEVSYYDARNEASVLMACDVCRHLEDGPELNILDGGKALETEFELDTDDGVQIEAAMADYLAADSGNAYKDFVDYALYTHRTLQQNLTRFFLEWFHREKKNSLIIQNISAFGAEYPLPFI